MDTSSFEIETNNVGEEFPGSFRSHKHVECEENKPKQGPLYFVMPHLPDQPCSPPLNRCRGQSIKIIVTKKQLELLLTGSRQFQSIPTSFQVTRIVDGRGKCRKWQPSLAVIPEFQSF